MKTKEDRTQVPDAAAKPQAQAQAPVPSSKAKRREASSTPAAETSSAKKKPAKAKATNLENLGPQVPDAAATPQAQAQAPVPSSKAKLREASSAPAAETSSAKKKPAKIFAHDYLCIHHFAPVSLVTFTFFVPAQALSKRRHGRAPEIPERLCTSRRLVN